MDLVAAFSSVARQVVLGPSRDQGQFQRAADQLPIPEAHQRAALQLAERPILDAKITGPYLMTLLRSADARAAGSTEEPRDVRPRFSAPNHAPPLLVICLTVRLPR